MESYRSHMVLFTFCVLLFVQLAGHLWLGCAGEGVVSTSLPNIISKYEAYLSRLPHISFEYGVRSEGEVEDSSRRKVKFDGTNVYYSSETVYGSPFGPFGGEQLILEVVNAPGYGRYFANRYTADGRLVLFNYRDVKNYPPILDSLGNLGIFFGRCYVNGQEIYIPDFLKELKDHCTLSVEGDDIVVSTNDNPYSFEFAFHQRESYLRKMDVALKEVKDASSHRQHKLSFEVLSFRLVDQVYFPERVRRASVFNDFVPNQSKPNLIQENSEYHLNDIHKQDLSSSDFVMEKITIEDGTECTVLDVPQIEYIWLDGKIVPKTDEAMLALLRGHGFMPGPDSPRFWSIVISIILIVVALSRLAYKYFTSKE